MRKVIMFAAVISSASAAAFAQQKQSVSLFLSDVTQTRTDRQTGPWPSGFGIGFERRLAERWSVQGAVAIERHHSYPYVVEDNGAITFVEPARLRTVPIDLTARYHWLNDTRWKPYLGFGAHYIAAPSADRRFRYRNHFDGEVNGGTLFMFSRSFGVVLDGRALAGTREPYDQPLKVSFGAAWRF